jgi:hypothetical protein
VNIYARRSTQHLIGVIGVLLLVGGFTILSPSPFMIVCNATCAACLVITFRSWYLIRRTLTKKERP